MLGLPSQRHYWCPDSYDGIVEILNGCGRFEYKYQGSTVKGSIDPMRINPNKGAKELAAWRLSLTVDDVNVEGYIAVATTEDALMYVGYADLFSADLTEFENLTALALAKAAA